MFDCESSLKLARIVDGRGFEYLLERQSGFMQLLHLDIAVQAGQVPIGRSRERIGLRTKLAFLAAR